MPMTECVHQPDNKFWRCKDTLGLREKEMFVNMISFWPELGFALSDLDMNFNNYGAYFLDLMERNEVIN